MLKKITLILVAAVLPLFAMAQTVKLGYINSQEVMMMMPEVNDVEKQLADFNEKNMKKLFVILCAVRMTLNGAAKGEQVVRGDMD